MAGNMLYTEMRYGEENERQIAGVWRFSDSVAEIDDSKFWFIFIHGGYFRDPRITKDAVIPTIDQLVAADSPIPRDRIAGFASLDYRLSPHPDYPQDKNTPPYHLHNARHPDHICDVRAGLHALQARFGFGSRYVLFGHSVGAFLAYQIVMGRAAMGSTDTPVTHVAHPTCIVGFEGVYDLRGLNDRLNGAVFEHTSVPFGRDEKLWDAVSPGCFRTFRSAWGSVGKLAVVAYSPEDGLVDSVEIDTMEKVLRDDGVRCLAFRDLQGQHDELLEDGRHIARVLGLALDEIDSLEDGTE